MGLDVTHVKLTLTPDDKEDFFYADEWELVCNVPIENYAPYIVTIDDLEFDQSIALVKNEADLKTLRDHNNLTESGLLKVFIGELSDATLDTIHEYIDSQGLRELETSQMRCITQGITYYRMAFGTPIKVKGMYYINNIGSRNKGMCKAFIENFRKYTVWGNKEDFELAYSFVGGEWGLPYLDQETVDIMKQEFKENFVDKFEFGRSLMIVST